MKEIFVMPRLPTNEIILLITIMPTIKVQILRTMAYWKALANPHRPKKFQRIHVQIGITAVCPDPFNPTYGTSSPVGIKTVQLIFQQFFREFDISLKFFKFMICVRAFWWIFEQKFNLESLKIKKFCGCP